MSGFCLFEIRLIFAFVDHILHNRNIKRFKKERYRQSAEILQVIKLEEKWKKVYMKIAHQSHSYSVVKCLPADERKPDWHPYN